MKIEFSTHTAKMLMDAINASLDGYLLTTMQLDVLDELLHLLERGKDADMTWS